MRLWRPSSWHNMLLNGKRKNYLPSLTISSIHWICVLYLHVHIYIHITQTLNWCCYYAALQHCIHSNIHTQTHTASTHLSFLGLLYIHITDMTRLCIGALAAFVLTFQHGYVCVCVERRACKSRFSACFNSYWCIPIYRVRSNGKNVCIVHMPWKGSTHSVAICSILLLLRLFSECITALYIRNCTCTMTFSMS